MKRGKEKKRKKKENAPSLARADFGVGAELAKRAPSPDRSDALRPEAHVARVQRDQIARGEVQRVEGPFCGQRLSVGSSEPAHDAQAGDERRRSRRCRRFAVAVGSRNCCVSCSRAHALEHALVDGSVLGLFER